ncbi:hypothetical protein [Paractinoplanes lichenicola]|uniref:Uncharacterized protein n=1 Tax=Paractinoplanes lichenicola TaxID=2802976 RepID=A0ABS1W5Z2_9ACTN|nr:hypothetical protein [Actinoplanes lichenicola]MBL7262149.1 hypothetical protein [Actinoplanes lichenicola]
MRKLIGAGAIAVTLAVLAGSSAQAGPPPRQARVTGTAEFVLTFSPDDDIRRFTFDVRANPYSEPKPGAENGLPTDATGTVKIYHWVAKDGIAVTAEASADCLITNPGGAIVTAIVTRADPLVADWVGRRLGFSVQDGGSRGPDRAGYSWSFSGDQDENGTWGAARIGTCLAPAPFAPVTRGDFTVRHVDLRPEK